MTADKPRMIVVGLLGFYHFNMKQKPHDFLYRSFLVDFLTQKKISVVEKRRISCQRIKFLEREYKFIYDSNPKEDFIPVKEKYNLPEFSYLNILRERAPEIKAIKIATAQNKNKKTNNYNDPDWKLKRLEVFKRDNNKCAQCKTNKNLQCHHSYYIPGRKLHEYPLDCFVTFCGKCHTDFHEKIKGSQLVIRGKVKIANKIKQEEFSGFYLKKETITESAKKNIKNNSKKKPNKKPKSKYTKSKKQAVKEAKIPTKDRLLQERRNNIIVPQWKIDEYKKLNNQLK